MTSADSLQNTYLDNLIKSQSLVSVFLKNSIRLRGYLVARTEEAVFLKWGNITQLIYKNKVTTVCPEIGFSNVEMMHG